MNAKKKNPDHVERAEAQFATNRAPWTDRTAPAIRNVIAPLVMEIDRLTMTPEIARTIRAALGATSYAHSKEALAWLNELYDKKGDRIDS